jgi:ribonuclease P protein component
MRLGRSRRLRKGPEFERVFKEGVAVGGPLLLVRAVPTEAGYSRWGLAVGKKSVPLAADRNRLRRQLKAAIQSLEPIGSFDAVVITRPAAHGQPFSQLRHELERVLRRSGFEVREG